MNLFNENFEIMKKENAISKKRNEELRKKNKMITETVTLLNDKVASLHLKINDMDLYNRRQNLEINGSPKYRNESCKKLVIGVLKYIDSTFTKNGLNVVHRIGKRNSRNCNNKRMYGN